MCASEVNISAAIFNNLIKILYEGQPRCSLTTLLLETKSTTWHDLDIFGTRAFQFLAAFNQLRRIDINFHDLIRLLDDDLIEQMAQGWPHVSNIVLACSNPAAHNTAKVTFKGLASVIELCPQLKNLSVPFTAVRPDPSLLERIQRDGVFNEALECFNVNLSPIKGSDVEVVAKLLMTLFPRLRLPRNQCRLRGPALALRKNIWDEVSKLVEGRVS